MENEMTREEWVLGLMKTLKTLAVGLQDHKQRLELLESNLETLATSFNALCDRLSAASGGGRSKAETN